MKVLERVDRRALAALRVVDATTLQPVEAPLRVSAPGVRCVRNQSGLHVVMSAPGLESHEDRFESPPDAPAPQSVAVDVIVHDPSRRFLPRRQRVRLPRDPRAAREGDSLFRPITVRLYPASSAAVAPNWAVLRLSVHRRGGDELLGGALLRVTSNRKLLASGLSDARGEALVAVPGIPITTWGDTDTGAVTTSEITANVEAVFDPATGTMFPASRIDDGFLPEDNPVVDPDVLEARHDTLPHSAIRLRLAAGRTINASLFVEVP